MNNNSSNFRRLAAVMIALLMLLGQFSTAFAAITPDEDGHIDYVSFGASVTNGYGLRGYLPDEVVADPFLADKNTLNVFGYGMAPEEGYPYLVKSELEDKGYSVDLKQYAISSMRVEELRVLLDNDYYGDEYTAWRFTGGETWFKRATTVWKDGKVEEEGSLEKTRKLYQEAVEESELITIEIGVNNFGVYSFNNIEEIVASGGERYWKAPKFTEILTDEEQKKFDEAKAYVLEELKKAGTDELMMKIADKMANVLAYATVGYMRNFDIVMQKIYELNPDANVVVITIQNLMEGLDMGINGVTVPIGEIYGTLIDMANMYTAVGSPYSDRYGYAQAAKDDLATTFLDELLAYNGDPTTLSDSMKDCFDMYDDNIYIRSKLQYIIAPWIVMQQKGMNVPFDKFANAAVKGIVNGRMDQLTAEEVGWLSSLLGILGIDQAFTQVAQPDELYVKLITSENYQNALNAAYNVVAQIMKEFGKITLMEVDIENFAEDYGAAQSMLIEYITTSAFEEAINVFMGGEPSFEIKESIFEDKNIVASAVLLLRFMVGNSFFAHPNAQGHKEVKDAIMETLEYSTTGKDIAIIEARDALLYLVDIISEYGPEIAEGVYGYLDRNGYVDQVKAEINKVESFLEGELEKIAKGIDAGIEKEVKNIEDLIGMKLEELAGKLEEAKNEIAPYIAQLKAQLADKEDELDAAYEHIKENHSDEIQVAIDALKGEIAKMQAEIAQSEKVLSQVEDSANTLKAEIESLGEILAQLKAKTAEAGTEIDKLTSAVKEIIKKTEDILGRKFDDINKEDVVAEVTKLVEEIESAAAEIVDAALYAETTREITARVTTAVNDLSASLERKIAAFEDYTGKDIETIKSELEALVNTASPEMKTILTDLSEDVEEIASIGREFADEAYKSAGVIAEEVGKVAKVVINEAEVYINGIIKSVEEVYLSAVTGEYVYTKDAYYVNLGDSITSGDTNYVDLVAAELGLDADEFKDLGNAGYRAEDIRYILDANYTPDAYGKDIVKDVEKLRNQYIEEIKKADFITLGIGNLTPFATTQLYNAFLGKDYDLDWAKIVGEDHVRYIDMAVAKVSEYFAQAGLPKIGNIDAAEILTTAVESYAYAYAGFAVNYAELVNDIHEINPDAEVVLVGSYNSLRDLKLEIDGQEKALGEYVDYLISLMDIQFTVYGMLTPNTTFVSVNDTKMNDSIKGTQDLLRIFASKGMYAGMMPSEEGHEYIKDRIFDAVTVKYGGGLGDVNLDGEVDAKDATQILRFVNAKTSVFDAKGKKGELIRYLADVDFNPGIEARDATQILRYCNAKTNTIEGR